MINYVIKLSVSTGSTITISGDNIQEMLSAAMNAKYVHDYLRDGVLVLQPLPTPPVTEAKGQMGFRKGEHVG